MQERHVGEAQRLRNRSVVLVSGAADRIEALAPRLVPRPQIGDLVVKVEVARFARTLATLLTNGVTSQVLTVGQASLNKAFSPTTERAFGTDLARKAVVAGHTCEHAV